MSSRRLIQVKDPDADNVYLHENWAAANRGVNVSWFLISQVLS